MRESDRCEQIYSICSGHVKLSCLSKIGQTLNLKIAFPGEVLGLGAAISAAKVELTAETMVPTVVKVIRRDEFLAFVNSHGEASLFAAQALAEEYKTAFSRARSLALSGVSGRVAGLLPELARSEAAGKTEPRFNMTLTHDDIAEFVSTTRETVSRTLARFREDKFIQINGSSVQILERSKLEALVA